jgi:hypothetical protein
VRLAWIGGGSAAWEATGSLQRDSVATTCASRSCSGIASIFSTPDGQRIETTFAYKSNLSYLPPVSTVLELRRIPD